MDLNPLTGQQIVSNVTMNVSQFLQLRQDILTAQHDALITGLVIGCIVGAVSVLAGMVWYRSKQ
jgi:hypothetical protein